MCNRQLNKYCFNVNNCTVTFFIFIFFFLPSKKDPDLLLKIMPNLTALFQDENVNVRKKVILVMAGLYRLSVQVSVIFSQSVNNYLA